MNEAGRHVKEVLVGELRHTGKSSEKTFPPNLDGTPLSVYSTRLHFYISRASDIVADIEEDRVECPCLWADVSDVQGHVAQLYVAYRLHGSKVHVGSVPVPAIKVKPGYLDGGQFGSKLASCSGNVSRRVYMVLFRLLHVLFPTLDAWNRGSVEAVARVPGLRVETDPVTPLPSASAQGGALYSLSLDRADGPVGVGPLVSGLGAHGVLVKPNFLLGCLEAVRQYRMFDDAGVAFHGDADGGGRCDGNELETSTDDDSHSYDNESGIAKHGDERSDKKTSMDAVRLVFEEQTCLKTVRHLDDVLGILKGSGSLDENSTPLSSPHKHRAFSFHSPAKKPLHGDKAMDIKRAVSMVEMGATSDFRDGALFLQTSCQSREKAEYAVRKGAFRALVISSSMMLASKVMGSVEQLSILTMTASQLLDRSSAASAPERVLVKEFVAALQRPSANPALLLHFLTAMIHRSDIKEAAIGLKMYNALAAMYIQKLPLLAPLADALVASPGRARYGSFGNGLGISGVGTSVTENSTTSDSTTNDSNNFMHGYVSTPKKVGNMASTTRGISVPPLLLAPQTGERVSKSPAGLTRATRRESNLAKQVVKDMSASISMTSKKKSAATELEQLAQALGESLVAKDLPSLIEHRRRLELENNDLFKTCESSKEDKWMLHQTASVADLRAHKILSGGDSSDPECYSVASDSDSDAVSGVVLVASNGQRYEDAYSSDEDDGFSLDEQSLLEGLEGSVDLSPYLINAMLAVHSPLPGCYALDPDPSHLITADIMSFPAHIYEGNQYVKSCLQLLTRISSSQAESGHVFLVAVGNKLRSQVEFRSFRTNTSRSSIAYFLDICLEYVSMCSDASMSTVFSETVLEPLAETLIRICAEQERVSGWNMMLLVMLNTVLKILVKALDLCATNGTRREYLLRFFGGEHGGLFPLLKNISTQTLLNEEFDIYSEAATELGEIEKNVLMLYSSLAALVAGAEPLDLGPQAKLEVGDDVICRFYQGREPKLLTRTYCMQCFSFLILPGTFLIRFSLEDEIQTSQGDYRLSSRSIRMRNGVFALLQGLFSAKDSPYIMDKELTDYYVRLHFIRFLKLYHNPNRDHQATFLCRQHLSMLCTLAQAARKSQGSNASKRFQHLSVVGFFVKEMSLEYEALESEVSYSQFQARSESSYDISSGLLDRTLSQGATSARTSYGSDATLTDDESDTGSRRARSGRRMSNSVVPPLFLSSSGGPFGASRTSTQDKDSLIPALTDLPSRGQPISATSAASAGLASNISTISGTSKASGMSESSDPGFGNLERQGTSMALSLGTPATPVEVLEDRSGDKDGLFFDEGQLPIGFTFTGDLDEDVDRLEALGLGSDDDRRLHHHDQDEDPAERGFSSSDVTDSDTDCDYSGASSVDDADRSPKRSPISRPGFPLSLTPDTDPSTGSKVNPVVPKLSISSSMRSSLHRRNESAELLHAVEEESQMRKAGRSYLGDMERQALGNGKMQAVRFCLNTSKSLGSLSTQSMEEMSKLERERSVRLLYQDDDLHVLAIKLVLMLIIDADGQLHSSYCDRFPWERKMQNIPFILQHHLNAEPTRHLLVRIESAVYESVGAFGTTFLKVLCADCFRPSWYMSRSRISGANGAYATVYRSSLPWWAAERRCVLKVIDLPRHNHDRCSQVEFYSEVAIHKKLADNPRVCRLYDFGVDTSADALVLVLEEFKCSLKQWRLRHDDRQWTRAPTYWAIFREIVVALLEVLEEGVVHFDVKCDNILLNPLEGTSEEAFWRGTTSSNKLLSLLKMGDKGGHTHLSMRVVLADFGESVCFSGGKQGAMTGSTAVSRGTDLFKSPEQLLVGGAASLQNGYDRRRHHQGAGAASDVWSLGVLLFELFTGTTLFSDSDWLQLCARVTTPGHPLLTPDKRRMIQGYPEVEDMIEFMLVRDPSVRPTMADVLHRLDSMSLDMSVGAALRPVGSTEQTPRSSPSTDRTSARRQCYTPDIVPVSIEPIDSIIHVSAAINVVSLCKMRGVSPRGRVVVLSSSAADTSAHGWDQLLRDTKLRDIFGKPDLQEMLETFNASAAIALFRTPKADASTKVIASWLRAALSDCRRWSGTRADAPLTIVSDETDGFVALLAIALLTDCEGLSMYSALVSASRSGLDRVLQHSGGLDVLSLVLGG